MSDTKNAAIQPYFTPREQDTPTRTRRKGQGRVSRAPIIEGGTYKVVNGKLELVQAPKVPKGPLHLRPNLFYRSADGRKVQIFAINKNSPDFPVIGMIETDGEWRPMVWNEKGITKRPYGAINDIIAPWSQT